MISTKELPEIVTPGELLSEEERTRFSRHLLLPGHGEVGQRRLKNARVLVIGAGGLGSPVLMYLCAAGVGTLGIVDDDVVEESNLQRQVIHPVDSVGDSKTTSAMNFMTSRSQFTKINQHNFRLDRKNILPVFSEYDLIIDGTDNFETRYLVNDAAAILGKPYVWASIVRFEGQVSVFWHGHGPQYRDLYPEMPPRQLAPSCSEGGVLGALCGAIGSAMAVEAIKMITRNGECAMGSLLTYDALSARWDCLMIQHDQSRTRPTALPSEDSFACSMRDLSIAGGTTVTSNDLRKMIEERERGDRVFRLIDVRERHEHETRKIDGSELHSLSRLQLGDFGDLLESQELILHCRSGVRSEDALRRLKRAGVERVRHLEGGIESFSSGGR